MPNAIIPDRITNFILPDDLNTPLLFGLLHNIGDNGRKPGRALRSSGGVSSRLIGLSSWTVFGDHDWYNFDWSLRSIDDNATNIIWLFGPFEGAGTGSQYYALGIVDVEFGTQNLQLFRSDASVDPITYTSIGTLGSTDIAFNTTYRIAVDATGAAGSNYPIVIWLHTGGSWVKEIDFGGDAAIDGINRCVIYQKSVVGGKGNSFHEVDHGGYIAHTDTNVELDDHIDPAWTVADWPVNSIVTGVDNWDHAGKLDSYMSLIHLSLKADSDWDKFYVYDKSVGYIDKTTDMNDETTSVIYFNDDSETEPDYVYLGYTTPFAGFFLRTVTSSAAMSFSMKYWNGTSFSALTMANRCDSGRQTGFFQMAEGPPADWVVADLAGVGEATPPATDDLYWLRLETSTASSTAAAYTFRPLERISEADNDVKQSFGFSDITSGKTPLYVNFILDWQGAAPDKLEVCSKNGGSVITTGTVSWGGAIPKQYDLGTAIGGTTLTEAIFNDMQIKFWDSTGADRVAATTVIAYVFAKDLTRPSTITTGTSADDVCVAVSTATFIPRVMVY